ncbi:protoporphyrinogen oxidase HemJ [Rhizobiaceae bacterium n13]|uniref:Protoporphyrinogen IX oxidase n=1 Tax=Ferirhizobium litorale TaxID=2927786 RepID=A0AAE3QG40_9HYPH|nr:protoporphyrinogen oxidase HemJ [Fererhizobium litorale]MDI7863050.1 protoporphyrinogen oxidase HemJ [Fererhizobium litorale]MDI7923273.1 protoporphyrinogen oxidase HemJ [Fererhizobium litorale]
MAMERQTDSSVGARARMRAAIAFAVFVALVAGLYLLQPDSFDLWIKAFHIVAVISWMVGLLYMPRLFVYHTDAEPGSVQSETFTVMEQRLLNVIMRPAMMIAWVLGLYLAWSFYGFHGGWLHAKIALVVVLSWYHEHLAKAVGQFAVDGERKSARYWRLMNEIPTVLMICIVVLVVVKPF